MSVFSVEVHLRCTCPSSVRTTALHAVEATLSGMPKKVLSQQLSHRHPPYELELSVISSPAMRNLNHLYRKKDRPTDVLAFSQLEVDAIALGPQIGEIMVCWAVAKKQAKENGITALHELQQLVVHGVLHVFGYDHEVSETEAERMFMLQNKIMAKLTK